MILFEGRKFVQKDENVESIFFLGKVEFFGNLQ